MTRIWKISAVATDWKRSVCIPIPKKDNAKECSNYCTIALISHASKVMLKLGFNSMWTENFQMCKLDLEKSEEPEIKLPTSTGPQKKHEKSKNTSTSASLNTLKPLIVWITTNCGKFLKKWWYQTALTILRNLHTDQKATVRKGHGPTDWFQTGKGVCQGCVLSLWLFNLYAEYI